jgi:glycine cleavage system H protein
MRIPENLYFSKDHEWVKFEGTEAHVGVTDYAQDALGDVVYVDLPKVGSTIQAGDVIGEVESTKSVSELYSPVSGVITSVNEDLSSAPELVNSDPYGAGWICVITISGEDATSDLLSPSAYANLTDH